MNDDFQNPLTLNYPRDLPICEHREEILSKLRDNSVIIVCGDTGSGKTTQLPKMALELGRAKNGKRIACTQPRRLAAVTVAERVATELKTKIGSVVGFQHRYAREVSDETKIKFMTDGVLLAETRADPLLLSYDTIIIDEAHERNLNVDFLLGILKRILAKRRDLKVIISSATLDTEKFSDFFNNAPAIIVPGRLFPVDIRFAINEDEEVDEEEDRDLPRAVASALRELPPRDDVLVFLPGERDIRETADHLSRTIEFRSDAILPLMASLPASEQKRAFATSEKRRVILATNVAETSLTIPGIRAVIDSGLARISRYIHRTQIQRLQIERISQASARQRAGRCGRVGPGICIRLYSEKDFSTRDDFTPPEILRSSLAGVILAMLDLKLGNIENFPFIDPPKPTMIREGLRELLELGAIEHNRDGKIALTRTGRQLAMIPVEPRLAKILLSASRFATLPSAIPIVAAMSCDDPKRRPIDEREKADQAHAQFRVANSDFLGTLKLWNWWETETKELSQTRARALAKKNYLSYPKIREWRELTKQLTELAKRLKLDLANDNGGDDSLHRAIASGFLSRLGFLDKETLEYRGAHALRFAIHPASVLAKRSKKNGLPEWIIASELVDTAKLYARNAAAIDSRWIEELAKPLCKYSYRDPAWDATNGFVRAIEQVTLYGLIIVRSRRRDFSRIDPILSRKLFILHAMILGEFPNPPLAIRENIAIIKELREQAECLRKPEIFNQDALAKHFELAIPREIVSAGDLRKFLAIATKEEIAKFKLNRRDWIKNNSVASSEFPKIIKIANATFNLSYRHNPENPETDGVTCTAKKSQAQFLRLLRHDWLVPGFLHEKVLCLLNLLPSALRRVLAPIEDAATVLTPMLKVGDLNLTDALRVAIRDRFAIRIASDAWDNARLPQHLLMRFCIRDDESGKIIASSRDLETALRDAGISVATATTSALAIENNKKYTSWEFDSLKESITTTSGGWTHNLYPALRDEGDGVTIHLFKDAKVARAYHELGITRLLYLSLFKGVKENDCLYVACREVAIRDKPAIRTRDEFINREQNFRREIKDFKSRLEMEISSVQKEFENLLRDASELASDIYDDIETQIAWMTFPHFVRLIPYKTLSRYEKYAKALKLRIQRAKVNPGSDRAKMERISPYWEMYQEAVVKKTVKIYNRAALNEFRWMLEEFRISLFAQELKTAYPISPQRLDAKWHEATEESVLSS